MAESREQAMEQCDALAPAMGELAGGAIAVPAFAGGLIATAETGPLAIIGGGVASYNAYESASKFVEDNWHSGVCEPISALTDPNSPNPLDPLPFYIPPPPEALPSSPALVEAAPTPTWEVAVSTTDYSAPSYESSYSGHDSSPSYGDSSSSDSVSSYSDSGSSSSSDSSSSV